MYASEDVGSAESPEPSRLAEIAHSSTEKKLALLSCLQKLQKCLPHEALATPSGVALPPLLAVRQATEVKSQHNYAGDMLDLIGKERDDTLKLLQELASMYYKEPGDYT